MSELGAEVKRIAEELAHAEGMAAPHPNYPGKESSLHREGLLLDAKHIIAKLWEGRQNATIKTDNTQALYNALETIKRLTAEREQMQTEIDEQCRINGLGGERELALMAKVEQQRELMRRAREALLMMKNRCAFNEVIRADSIQPLAIEALNALDAALKGSE